MIVYKITNTINGKLYFGITKCSLDKRWTEHKSRSRTGQMHISLAIRKYGVDAFTIEKVLDCVSEKEMYETEIALIKKYNTNNPKYGYNNSTGGEASSLGKKISQEVRDKISKAQKNKKRKPHSEAAKQKMREAAKGRDMSLAILASSKKRKGAKAFNRVKICQYSKDGMFIRVFDSLTDAAKCVNGIRSGIIAARKGDLKTYKGFIWKSTQ